jgi:RES domain
VPDWASAGPDGTFGNRFDDPDATYRVLYASSQRLGCFLETLARFRIDPKLAAELAAIEGEEDYFPLGEVPVEWLRKRILGIAIASGEYADICSSEWISRLRKSLATHLSRFGVEDIDASVLQKTAPRSLTQFVSRIVFYAALSGIYYLSKYGHDIENWALFEPFQINVRDPEIISVEDQDLQLALRLHSLKFKE